MQFAVVLSKRSIDPRLQVGCLIVSGDNTQVLSIGYNGDYRGGPNLVESLEPGKSQCIHAEENALIKLDFNSQKRKVMYVTHFPCDMCSRKIINGGIDEIIYGDEYRDMSGMQKLRDSGIVVRQFKPASHGSVDLVDPTA